MAQRRRNVGTVAQQCQAGSRFAQGGQRQRVVGLCAELCRVEQQRTLEPQQRLRRFTQLEPQRTQRGQIASMSNALRAQQFEPVQVRSPQFGRARPGRLGHG